MHKSNTDTEIEHKRCRTRTGNGCGFVKPLSAFNRQASSKDGRASICAACNATKCADRYQAKKEWYRDRDAQRDPVKQHAHSAANYAVKVGKLKKPTYCQEWGCHAAPDVKHHPNYGEPLSVIWFCNHHHDASPAWRKAEERAAAKAAKATQTKKAG